MDGQILACYKGKILTPQDAPPLAATLRDKAKGTPWYPALWKEPKPVKPRLRKWRIRKRKVIGPLAGDGDWLEDPVRRNKHRELTRAGIERARQAGKQIGMLPVEVQDGFAEKFTPIRARLEQRIITRKQAARELGISGPTLKRILDGRPTPTRQRLIADEGKALLVV